MIRKMRANDPNGNSVYFHTSSDIVWDPDTNQSVKDDLNAIKNIIDEINDNNEKIKQNAVSLRNDLDIVREALDITDDSEPGNISIDADTFSGKSVNDFMLKTDHNVYELLNGEVNGYTTVFELDGSITDTYVNGYRKITIFNSDKSISEKVYNADRSLVCTRTITFNENGSIETGIVMNDV